VSPAKLYSFTIASVQPHPSGTNLSNATLV
jgi:hypothetical protein